MPSTKLRKCWRCLIMQFKRKKVTLNLNFLKNIYSKKGTKRVVFMSACVIYFLSSTFFILNYGEGENALGAFGFSILNTFIYYLCLLPSTAKPVKLLRQMIVPASYIMASFLLLNFFPNLVTVFKLAFILCSVLIYYFLLLSFNVFFVVEEKGSVIPLLRPARTTFLLIQIVAAFFFFTAIYKIVLFDPFTEVTFLFQTFIVTVTSLFFAKSYWWSQNLEDEITSFVGNESLVIAFITGFTSIALSFYPTESFFRSLGISVVYYISINFFQSVVTHRFSNRLLFEYFVIGILALFFILFV